MPVAWYGPEIFDNVERLQVVRSKCSLENPGTTTTSHWQLSHMPVAYEPGTFANDVKPYAAVS